MFWAYYMYMWWRSQHERFGLNKRLPHIRWRWVGGFGLNKRQPHIRWRWVGGRGWSAWHVPFLTPTRKLEDAPNRHEPAIGRLNCGRVSLTLVRLSLLGTPKREVRGSHVRSLKSKRRKGHRIAVGHEAALAFIGNGSTCPGNLGRRGHEGVGQRAGDDRGGHSQEKGPDRERVTQIRTGVLGREGREKVKRHAREVELDGIV